MPGHHSAIWGTVYHSLLDEIWKGLHRDADLRILIRDRVVGKIEEDREQGILHNQGDMKSTTSRREITRRARRLEKVREDRKNTPVRVPGQGGGTRRFGREVWVDSSDTRIRGLIDEVTKENGTVVITDDKTGEFREEYLEQIRIYGLLWCGSGFEPVIRLQLRKSGEITHSEIQGEEDRNLILEKIHHLEKSLQEDSSRSPTEIASPSEENCMWCPFRIECGPLHELANSSKHNTPGTYKGVLQNIKENGGGKAMLSLEVEGKGMQTEVKSDWCDATLDDLGKEILLHAFYRHSLSKGILNPRKSSHYVSIQL